MTWEGIIPRKRRKSFERFLHHGDSRIRARAKETLKEDQTTRTSTRHAAEQEGIPAESERQTLAEMPFRELVQGDEELLELRQHYAALPAGRRRMAAEMEYDTSYASFLVGEAVSWNELIDPEWRGTLISLAIDPDFAPAILAVGSLEYQYSRVEEAMGLFLKLTSLPADTDELPEIIDKAGDFLIEKDDYANAEKLYAAAADAYPEVALFQDGLGYCISQAGRTEEAVARQRRAVELEPDNYLHLNDLGYTLLQAGQYNEAEKVLQRAVRMAPPESELSARTCL